MDQDDFDIDRSIATAWEAFTARLAEVVSVIDEGGSLRLGASDQPSAPAIRFTQLEAEPDLLLAEVIGDDELEPLQRERLLAEGWQAPDPHVDPPRPHAHLLRPQEEAEELADLATRTLWKVLGVPHPVFLAPDQLAEVLNPEPTPTEDESVGLSGTLAVVSGPSREAIAVLPRDRAHLDSLITAELTEIFGHAPVRDADGDVTIRVGSSMVFVRTSPRADEVLLFSALVHDVEGRSRAAEVLNDLNAETRQGRFSLVRDRVFVSIPLFAQPFVPAHLRQALAIISRLADEIDDLLATKLRGRTTFSEEA